ncbi:nitroreductase/dihydropteridine reductase [Albidovulum inexpectatum]|uniref:Nitroreductase/dihydropteridine reductase n=1 Tax=Albidovulum inexpectatum TaxID=196587 RepID=A0A2S5JJ44_9RHOB|nr:oxygen-insensitive NAD(P)H nitroreductase [Albidovulum inexpectatum]PPB81480.1 nitroreductase/dihydropteridine reductase [Albidovulum inexpectatum]
MTIHITDFARQRHTAKAYLPDRRISDADMEKVRALLRLAPSSVNLQPWHFVIAATDEAKARVARAAEERYPFNTVPIRTASHVVVFASLVHADETYLKRILAQEEADGRFGGDDDRKQQMHAGRSFFVGVHQDQIGDGEEWMTRQLYLNLGHFLLGVAALGIDATPMEGVDTEILDAEFGLREKGYRSRLAVALGYSDPKADYNRFLPKSRLPENAIIEEL